MGIQILSRVYLRKDMRVLIPNLWKGFRHLHLSVNAYPFNVRFSVSEGGIWNELPDVLWESPIVGVNMR